MKRLMAVSFYGCIYGYSDHTRLVTPLGCFMIIVFTGVNQCPSCKVTQKMASVADERKPTTLDAAGLQPVRAVAEFLAISRSKVYQLMDGGHLPYVKFGRSRRVRWADVLRLVEENLKSK